MKKNKKPWRRRLNFNVRNFLIWLSVFGLIFVAFQFIPGSRTVEKPKVIPFSEFLSKLEDNEIKRILVKGKIFDITTKSGKRLATYGPYDSNLGQKLSDSKVRLEFAPAEQEMPSLFQILISWLPLIILLGLVYMSVRNIQVGGNKALGFGRSRAKIIGEKSINVSFDDVAGVEEAKEELQEIVEFLKSPKKFQRLGGKIPRGVLLSGPPGSGKTLLARAIAGEANVMFFSISGSDFVEMFVGVGASRVRDMFEQAKRNSPCIIFIDEIDAVGRKRSHGLVGGHEEREQTLNQLLVEMDGFEQNQGIIVIGSTNRPDMLDTALLRPGRFDRRIVLNYPDLDGREKILKIHTEKVPLDKDVDLRVIAKGTPGFSGADLANLVNEATLMAAKSDDLSVEMKYFEAAKDKILMGSERKSWLMSPEERRIVAFHEAGHAVVAFFTEGSHPIHKITIIPRGQALGMVVRLPEKDQLLISKQQFLADVMVAMGGRLSEQQFFGGDKVTAGAANDIEKATAICRRMVIEWGLTLDDKQDPKFQNYQIWDDAGLRKDYDLSEETKKSNDSEVIKILNACYKKAATLLKKKKDLVEKLAESLLKYETLTSDEVQKILEKGKLLRKTKTKEKEKISRRLPKTVVDEEEPSPTLVGQPS